MDLKQLIDKINTGSCPEVWDTIWIAREYSKATLINDLRKILNDDKSINNNP